MLSKEVFSAENSFGVTKSGNGAGNVRGYKRQTVCSGENLLSASADIGKKGEKGTVGKAVRPLIQPLTKAFMRSKCSKPCFLPIV